MIKTSIDLQDRRALVGAALGIGVRQNVLNGPHTRAVTYM